MNFSLWLKTWVITAASMRHLHRSFAVRGLCSCRGLRCTRGKITDFLAKKDKLEKSTLMLERCEGRGALLGYTVTSCLYKIITACAVAKMLCSILASNQVLNWVSWLIFCLLMCTCSGALTACWGFLLLIVSVFAQRLDVGLSDDSDHILPPSTQEDTK